MIKHLQKKICLLLSLVLLLSVATNPTSSPVAVQAATKSPTLYSTDFSDGLKDKFTQSGDASLKVVPRPAELSFISESSLYASGSALYISNRKQDYDAADITVETLNTMGAKKGSVYHVVAHGYIGKNETVPSESQAVLLLANSYAWKSNVNISAGEIFTLEADIEYDGTQKFRFQINDKGATVPFYLLDVTITTISEADDSSVVYRMTKDEDIIAGKISSQGMKNFVNAGATLSQVNNAKGGNAILVERSNASWRGIDIKYDSIPLLAKTEYKYTITGRVPNKVPNNMTIKLGVKDTNTIIAEATVESNGNFTLTGTKLLDTMNDIRINTNDAGDGISFIIDEIVISKTGNVKDDPFAVGMDYDKYPSLKDYYENYFLIGTTGSVADIRSDFVKYHFNSYTFENSMKPDFIQKVKGIFTFAAADKEIVDVKALNPNMQFVGHTLSWHSQTQGWMWDAPNFNKATAQTNLDEHFTAVLERYGKDLYAMDVVNEAVGGSSSQWKDAVANKGEGWAQALGSDFIEIAFLKAAEIVDKNGWDCKLYYNEISVESGDKAQIVYDMVKEINEKHAGKRPNGKKLIEGIGIQGHYNKNVKYEDVEANIKLLATLPGVKLSFTEVDIEWLNSGSLSQDDSIKQAQKYAQLFQILKKYAAGTENKSGNPKVIERVTFWGSDDATSWKKTSFPLLFNAPSNGKITGKEALVATLYPDEYLEKHPDTSSDDEEIIPVDGIHVYSTNNGDSWSGANIILGNNANQWPWSTAGEDGKVAFTPEKDATYRISVNITPMGTNMIRVRWINDAGNGNYTQADGNAVGSSQSVSPNQTATQIPAYFNSGMINGTSYTLKTEIKLDGNQMANGLIGNIGIRGGSGGNSFIINWITVEKVGTDSAADTSLVKWPGEINKNIDGFHMFSTDEGDSWSGANIILGNNDKAWPWSTAGEDGKVAFTPEKDASYRISVDYTSMGTNAIRIRWIGDNSNGGYTQGDANAVNASQTRSATQTATQIPAYFNSGIEQGGRYTLKTEIKLDGNQPANGLIGNIAIRGGGGGNSFVINNIIIEKMGTNGAEDKVVAKWPGGVASYSSTVSDLSLDFGSVSTTYDQPDAKIVKFTNTGNSDITDLQVALTGDKASNFSIENGGTNITVKPGAYHEVKIKPNANLIAGVYNATLNFASASHNETNKDVALSFKVNSYSSEISDLTLSFGRVNSTYTQPDAKTLKFTNTGNSDITDLQVALTGDKASSFSIENGGTNITIKPGAYYEVKIRPNAKLKSGVYNANVNFASASHSEVNKDVALTFTVNSPPPVTEPDSSSNVPAPPAPTLAPTPAPTPTVKTQEPSSTQKVESIVLDATTDDKGVATVEVLEETMNKMIDNAKQAESEGKQAVIEIKVESSEKADIMQVELPKEAFSTVANNTETSVKLDLKDSVITFDNKALNTINNAADKGDIVIKASKVSNATLSDDVQQIVGTRPVFDFSVQAGDVQVSQFDGGKASISIPYELEETENPNAIVVYYIDDNDSLKTVRGKYNDESNCVDFAVKHFSKYAIAYNLVTFTDVPSDVWYSSAVDFIAARGITSGVTENTFAPMDSLTRGQFIVMLMRAYNIDQDDVATDNFSDAGNTYYTNYLSAAKRLGITNGVGNNQYAPDAKLTQQEMYTLLYNALNAIGELPSVTESNYDISDFKDASMVDSWAVDAMSYMVNLEVANGTEDGMLSPKDNTIRANMAQALYILLSKYN